MGIRVKKQMGWISFQDLDISNLSNYTLQDLLNENKNDAMLQLDTEHPLFNPNDKLSKFVTKIDPDTAGENWTPIYIFTPPGFGHDWSQVDNAIDRHENPVIGEPQVKLFHTSVFPYPRNFVVSKTLQPLDEVKTMRCLGFSKTRHTLLKEAREELEELGLDFDHPLAEQIHMVCPRIIELILKKCSNKPPASLMPGLVKYWS